MSLFGNVELKTTELPDALEFTVMREGSLLETVGIPAITIIVMWAFFWRTGNPWLRLISGSAVAFTIFATVANRIQGGETRLRVTLEGVVAEGNLGQLFSTSVSVAIADISSIGYYDGGDGGIWGLYVRHGWRFTPLLPHLSPDQSRLVVDAIANKFPGMPAETALNTHVFGDGGRLIGLGLAKNNTKRPDEPV